MFYPPNVRLLQSIGYGLSEICFKNTVIKNLPLLFSLLSNYLLRTIFFFKLRSVLFL